MIFYKGCKCPVCTENFQDEKDIVVCPICGTPHHRKCYEKNNQCFNIEKHNKNWAWSNKNNYKQENSNSQTNKIKTCPRCFHQNNNDSLFCEKCGFALNSNNNNSQSKVNNPFFIDPLGGINPNEKIENVTAFEISQYVKINTQYYLPTFKKIEKTSKNKFNFGAFVFGGIWMLFRKQYKIGAIFTSISLILNFCLSIFQNLYLNNIFEELAKIAGVNLSKDYYLSLNDYTLLSQNISSLDTQKQLLLLIPFIIYTILFLIHLIIGFKANKIYFKKCILKIKEIKNKNLSNQEHLKEINKKGGVNFALPSYILILKYFFLLIIDFFS